MTGTVFRGLRFRVLDVLGSEFEGPGGRGGGGGGAQTGSEDPEECNPRLTDLTCARVGADPSVCRASVCLAYPKGPKS